MTGMDDDTLRRIIGRSDPARSMASADDHDITRLMEEAMSDTRSTPQSTSGAPSASRRPWLFGGLGVLGAAAAAAVAVPLALGPASSVTVLEQPAAGGPAAMCAVLTPEFVAEADSAFRAEVTGIDGGTVTLHVLDRFAGEVGDTIEVPQGTSAGVDGEPITFEASTTYLLATRDGMILTCGTSGVDSPELDAIYTRAFPG